MTRLNVSLRLSVFAALLALAFTSAGCSGGCGQQPEQQSAPNDSSGSPAASGGGGTASVGSGEFTGAIKNSEVQAPAARPQAARSPAFAGPIFEEISKASYERKVLKILGGALVVCYTPDCPRWKAVRAALKGVSHDLAGQIAVYRINVARPEQAQVLPSGLTATPAPSFIYYEGGLALAQRQGLPFDVRVGRGGEPLETSEEYQQRLRRWFRSAIAMKNLQLPQPK